MFKSLFMSCHGLVKAHYIVHKIFFVVSKLKMQEILNFESIMLVTRIRQQMKFQSL